MPTKQIWLIDGCVEYESQTTLRAFETKDDAEHFAQRCRNHDGKKKRCPDIGATHDVWEKWATQNKKWEAAHPAGGGYDYYSVYSLKLTSAKKVRKGSTGDKP